MKLQRLAALSVTLLLSFLVVSPAHATTTAEGFSSTRQYAQVLRSFNPTLSHAQSRAFADRVRMEAEYYRLDARLLVALVATESSWHPYATSPVGAGGLGQLMPGTAAGLGVNPYSPYANLSGTAHYLRGLLDRFSAYNQQTRYSFALAGYNAGPGAVERYGRIPPYSETQNYVRNVMGIWRHLSLSLSSHIDDYVHSAAYTAHPRRPILLAQTARKIAVGHTVKRKNTPPQAIAIATVPVATPAQTHKIFFLHWFHHHGMGPDTATRGSAVLALRVPASVGGGDPIPVTLDIASKKPVTLMAFIGDTVVAQGTMPAHSKHALLRGVPAADAVRIVVVRAYAKGYDEAHAALTITAAQKVPHVTLRAI
ncbi:MAG: lytic transglycosylase domain-containing protein [Candidatus Baltobacteraceae bacterium]